MRMLLPSSPLLDDARGDRIMKGNAGHSVLADGGSKGKCEIEND
jgi:hypothetical protein